MKQNAKLRSIELLAPARNADVAIAAIKCGADAVYIGAESHGARVAAGNSVEDIARVVEYAHKFFARVYVTLNTIIYDDEIHGVERLITRLYDIGVDALIVQDMGVLRMKIPPIALHASTQCDTRDALKAKFLQDVGFSQIVVARELSLDEINEIYKNIDVPIEAFVHGALCVSYSGDCQASYVALGRSANRGECAQMCRLPYTLIDFDGNKLIEDKHLLCLRDMNRGSYISEMIEVGVSSFKIEGRLKDVGYVKNIVSYYRRAIDRVIAANPDKYCRASQGVSIYNFDPNPIKSFNRGFTSYFLTGNDTKIASIDTPKSIGEFVGRVKSVGLNNIITAELSCVLNNGDGIVYFDKNRVLTGFRLNKIQGNKLYPAGTVKIMPGTRLYRNNDKNWNELILQDGVSRLIDVEMRLSKSDNNICIEIRDDIGHCVAESIKIDLATSHTPQEETRKRVLAKLGNTIYRAVKVEDKVGDYFIPVSLLTDLRRRAIARFDVCRVESYKRDYRKTESNEAKLPQGISLSYHDNVSNHLAESFYKSHGALEIERAIEQDDSSNINKTVMTSRYCIRRELGQCLKTSNGKKWKAPLFLLSASHKFRLEFNCQKCRMSVIYLGEVNNNG